MGSRFKNFWGRDRWSGTLQEKKLKIRSHQPGRDGRSCCAHCGDDRIVHGIFTKSAKQMVPRSFLASCLLFTGAILIPEVRMSVRNISIKELVSLNSIAMGDSYGIATHLPARDEMRPLLSVHCQPRAQHPAGPPRGGQETRSCF